MFEPKTQARASTLMEIAAGYDGQRIDNFLICHLKGVPRSYIYRILRRGEVRVNKGRIRPDYRLQEGDVVRIPPLRLAEKAPEPRADERVLQRLQDAVLYEDRNLLVLNKPAGIAVHGGSGLSYGLIEALRLLRPQEQQLELVHRLDRETSGCLMVAKRRSALRILHELLRGNRVDKRYLALLAGRLEPDRIEVDAPLLKNILQSGERMVRVDERGKPALTRFRVLRRLADATLVEARPVTGRTHQIRVHAAHLGTPILGDEKYGVDETNRAFREQGLRRLFLHAASLRFRWPEAERDLCIEAALDEDLQNLLERLEK